MKTNLPDRPRPPWRDYLDAALSPNTRRAYAHAWREFAAFCAAASCQPLPADEATLLSYISWLDRARRNRPSTVRIKLAALRYVHARAHPSAPNPVDAPAVRDALVGLARLRRATRLRKGALLTPDLARALALLPDTPAGRRDRALLLLGFAGAFRRSELVSLNVADLTLRKGLAVLRLRGSKGDPTAQGESKVIHAEADPALCPVRALQDWLATLRARRLADGPLFTRMDATGKPTDRRLSAQSVALIVKRIVAAAGLDPRQFSGHSLRAGFITAAALAGAQEHDIQRVSGHKSADVLRQYIRDSGVGQQRAQHAAFSLRE
jgi:integrase